MSVSSALFYICTSAAEGGALAVSGGQVSAQVMQAVFDSCSSDAMGGAVSASISSSLSLVSCVLKGNTAWGMGGGAVHLSRCYFAAYNTSVTSSRALHGGGGALFWQGWVRPASIIGCQAGTGRVEASCSATLADNAACHISSCAECNLGKYQNQEGLRLECISNENLQKKIQTTSSLQTEEYTWGGRSGDALEDKEMKHQALIQNEERLQVQQAAGRSLSRKQYERQQTRIAMVSQNMDTSASGESSMTDTLC